MNGRGAATTTGRRTKKHAFLLPDTNEPLCRARNWRVGEILGSPDDPKWDLVDCGKCLEKRGETKPELEINRCQFCEKDSPAKSWKGDKCPKCGGKYDAILAQEGDD